MKLDSKKFRKMAKYLRITCGVLLWCSIIFGIGCIIITVASFILPEKIFMLQEAKKDPVLRFNNLISYRIVRAEYGNFSTRHIYQLIAPLLAVITAMIIVILYQVRGILKTVEVDKPFDEKNPTRLFIIAVDLIVASFVSSFCEYLIARMMVDAFKLKNFVLHYGVNLGILLPGLLILLLAGVFKYGNYLQKEYDSMV